MACLYSEVLSLYARFVRYSYGTEATIVFDAYDAGPSTKDQKHRRLAAHSAPQIQVDETHQNHDNQSSFFANSSNKSKLILLLHRRLEKYDQILIQASGDAD